VGAEGEADDSGVVGAPFQPLEDVMGVETASNRGLPRLEVGEVDEAGTQAPSELPEGMEREEGEDKEDYKERLKLATGDDPTKQNIERLKRVKPSLSWKDIAFVFGMSQSSVKNILSGKREEVPKKKTGRKKGAKGKK
jgi:DNA-directed RNA polymerase specialized sigma24 family protein